MKIVINGVSAKMGGAVSYLTNLLQHLPPPESNYQFFVFLPEDTAKLLRNVPGNVKLHTLPSKAMGGWRRFWWEQVTLRRFLRKEKADLLFSTANFAMLRCPVKQILLVRNALYFSKTYRQMFLRKHGLRYKLAFALRRWLIVRSVRSADVVMTPTQAMLDELAQFVTLEGKKVFVNHYGTDCQDGAAPRAVTSPAGANPAVIRLIYVSLYSEHKNLSTLLEAMALLNSNGSGKYLLTTTVNPAWEGAGWTVTHKADLALAQQPEVARYVEFMPSLTARQVRRLYGDACLAVFPSLCESFGHPLVDAMVHGIPIVASDTPVNHEMCGNAAIYFSPLDSEDLARQIRRVASDAALQQRMRAKAREQVPASFCWNAHVGKILDNLNSGT